VVPASATRVITPERYRTLALNADALAAILESAPVAGPAYRLTADQGVLIQLPMPDGTMQRFRIVNAPIMAPELAARYPEIQTYRGVGLEDPTASVRLDVTPVGFHAQILSAGPTVYIDPLFPNQTELYQSFYRRDYLSKTGSEEWFCAVDDLSGQKPKEITEALVRAELAVLAPRLVIGTQLRTYRLAVATTGEYTDYQARNLNNPTNAQKKAAALAAIVTTMNRVNGIYEREVAIRMILVANNDAIIYTDGESDPYTNDDGGAMLAENQTTIDAVIGSANYDIGHVFSTGGGGIAYLNGPCNASYKAGGVTGSGAPEGDAFDVDYVAHEIGHQFGADHTFNGASGACGGGNRSGNAAFEPGSGTTIMAYAGICDPQNVQNNSDPYFHAFSLDEMVAFSVNGNGNSCAVVTPTGNQPPVVAALAPYTIPARTPFRLTGSASDGDGHTLSYQWQQMDLGSPTQTAEDIAEDDGSRPLFRVFNPTATPQRVFPQWSDILDRTPTMGEALPTTTRSLNFRLLARDNQDGGGGVGDAAVKLDVVDTGAAFAVTRPADATTWSVGASNTVTWDVAGTDQSPIDCSAVDILLSTDGGTTFPVTLANDTPNDGAESVVPATPTTQGRIQVVCADNVFFAVSYPDFSIVNANNVATFNGVVTNEDGAPIEGALVTFSNSAVAAVTDETGAYSALAAPGVYNLTFTAAGYQPAVVTGVSGAAGSVVTTDVVLTPLPSFVLNGVVSDEMRDFPLYASVTVQPGAISTWSDPENGVYTLTLLQGISYTVQSTPWIAGYTPVAEIINAASANATLNFDHAPIIDSCSNPGFADGGVIYTEGFESTAGTALPEGWAINGESGGGDWASTEVLNISPEYGDVMVTPHGGSRQVYFNSFDIYPGETARLYREFDLGSVSGPSISFWFYHSDVLGDYNDSVQVQVCTATNCNANNNWTDVGPRINRLDAPVNQWVQHTVNLAAYGGQVVKVGLLGISDYGAHLTVDDIVVSACSPLPGGLIVGATYNTSVSPLAGVVISGDGRTVTSTITPDDPAVADAFYSLWMPAGSATLTATAPASATLTRTVTVVDGATQRQDFIFDDPIVQLYLPSVMR
jgi:hypothetical protein